MKSHVMMMMMMILVFLDTGALALRCYTDIEATQVRSVNNMRHCRNPCITSITRIYIESVYICQSVCQKKHEILRLCEIIKVYYNYIQVKQ